MIRDIIYDSIDNFVDKFIGDKFDKYKDEIHIRSYDYFKGYVYLGMFCALLILVSGIVLHKYATFTYQYFLIVIYFIFLIGLLKLFINKHLKYVTVTVYMTITPIMIAGIVLGTFLHTYGLSVTIMILLCVLPLFIIDKPWRVTLYITSISVLYCIACFIAKDYIMFMRDMVDLVTFYIVSISINYYILNERIDSVENYVRYRDKSEMDLLTGIYNRGCGVEKIENVIQKNEYGSFIIIDMDNFKFINDNFGHITGDQCLQAVSIAIRGCFKDDEIVMRLGGDEFAVYSTHLRTKEECIEVLDKLILKVKRIRVHALGSYTMTISAGCSFYDENILDFNELYKNSDQSLYEAKNQGKGCYKIKSNNSVCVNDWREF